MLLSFGSPVDADDAASRKRGSVGCLVSFGSLVVVVEFFMLTFKFFVTDLQPWLL
jgi:hypothetical protein